MEKVQWNSIDKTQNGLKYSKNDKSSTLPPYNNNKQNVVIFFKKWKKYNEMQLTKNKMD